MKIQILFIPLILPSLAHAHGMSESEIQTILEGGNLQFLNRAQVKQIVLRFININY